MDAIERRIRRLEEAMRVEDEIIVGVLFEVVTDQSQVPQSNSEPAPSPVPPGFRGRVKLVVIDEHDNPILEA